MKVKTNAEYRVRRHLRLRRKVSGTAERPRMQVFVSNLHMYVQFIDDEASRTLASASSQKLTAASGKRCSSEDAKQLGAQAAEAAKAAGISNVVFDRGGFPYRGRIKILAEAARENGLKF
ncbi:MAG TPA: 50S ribosomal protein L18 [Kiritimatiellia bacterium]|nr:50S ribosomal protein L18 [Kiritimatiellia bacterium]HMO98838.1 50S ribosomal protein L18 [Kiritimatiellia bacterium]HMP96214.1 50S ribosomal protein L18 [Kiritimatiellia bacterium]